MLCHLITQWIWNIKALSLPCGVLNFRRTTQNFNDTRLLFPRMRLGKDEPVGFCLFMFLTLLYRCYVYTFSSCYSSLLRSSLAGSEGKAELGHFPYHSVLQLVDVGSGLGMKAWPSWLKMVQLWKANCWSSLWNQLRPWGWWPQFLTLASQTNS